jgi:methylmalonyl-CoA epimerase
MSLEERSSFPAPGHGKGVIHGPTMIRKVTHIGLGVSDLKEASAFFRETLGFKVLEQENFGELIFSFIPMEGTDLELLQSTDPNGQIAKFIQKRGQGVHHIALEVDDIQAELDRLKAKGVALINEKPYLNAHKEWVAFLHPKSTFGVLIELIQAKEG